MGGPRAKLTRQQMVELDRAGVSRAEIAARAEVTPSAVSWNLKQAKNPKPRKPRASRCKLSRRQLVGRYNAGWKMADLAKAAGLSEDGVRSALRRFGVPLRGNPKKRRIEADQMEAMHRAGMSLTEIAEEAGVSRACVQALTSAAGYHPREESKEATTARELARRLESICASALRRSDTFARRQRAYQLFASSSLSVDEIAAELGFAFATTASRAARDWAELHGLTWPLRNPRRDDREGG